MLSDDTLERIARDLAAELPLPAEDWPAVLAQAKRTLAGVETLDELPLDSVEPAFLSRDRFFQ